MSRKSGRIAAFIEQFEAGERDAHYLAYFACFNRGEFYEAHDVLEQLWLAQRTAENGAFYKGLIQLAGAFVHLKKNRLGPAIAVFKLARDNLHRYPAVHEGLDVAELLGNMRNWLEWLETDKGALVEAPKLQLRQSGTVKAQ